MLTGDLKRSSELLTKRQNTRVKVSRGQVRGTKFTGDE
jgi:hypothetical protein